MFQFRESGCFLCNPEKYLRFVPFIRDACRRNLVLTDSLAFAIDFWMLPRYNSGALRHFFRSLTTTGDNRDRCQDTRLGQYSYLAHDRLLKFMALICGFI